LIFNLYSRVLVKVGDEERHIFDATRLMYTEVAEIEKCTGVSYGEWRRQLGDYSITAIAALLHVLRKRAGVPSDFATLQFNAAALDVVPLHEDDSEFTAAEVEADLKKRMADAAGEAEDPTLAAAAAVAPENGSLPVTTISSLSSPSGSESGPGNSASSNGGTSSSSSPISMLRPLPVPGTPHDAAAEVGDEVGDDGGDVAADAFGVVG
jgi:hypothetical protein